MKVLGNALQAFRFFFFSAVDGDYCHGCWFVSITPSLIIIVQLQRGATVSLSQNNVEITEEK